MRSGSLCAETGQGLPPFPAPLCQKASPHKGIILSFCLELNAAGYFQRICSLRPLSSTNSTEFELIVGGL